MNKRNFVTGFRPDKADFDGIQNDLENGLNRVASVLAGKGIRSGFDMSISGSKAVITPGVGFDALGNPLVSTENMEVDLGAVTRPPSGQYKWATIVLRYQIKESGQVVDIHNHQHPFLFLDSLRIEILEGVAGNASAILKPNLTDSQVPLWDMRIDNSSPWENLLVETNRRPVLVPVAEVSNSLIPLTAHKNDKGNPHGVTKMSVGLGNVPNWAAGNVTTMGSASNKFAPESAIVNYVKSLFPVGMTYAQYPGGKTPSAMGWPGIWTAQFENEGVFFRTPGGSATPFNGGVQDHKMASHGHQWLSQAGGATPSITGGWGFVESDYCTQDQSNRSWSSSGTKYRLEDDGLGFLKAGGSYGIYTDNQNEHSGETRSKNRTFRVWKRTS